jgi:HSP20 family molecular chaperone IbpA
MARYGDRIFDQFQQAFDDLFDDLLDRWGCRAPEEFERAELVDLPDRYQIRLNAEGLDPATVEVHTHERRVTVSAPAPKGEKLETSFNLPEAIDAEAATARWSEGWLTIVLPKHRVRRIPVAKS